MFAVRHECLPRLRHLGDGVFGGFVLGFDELIAGDGAGVVVCVGFLEVYGSLGLESRIGEERGELESRRIDEGGMVKVTLRTR